MRYPSEFIDKVQDSSSLLDIISQYTQLKASGAGFMGRCPFPDHQEKTASFSMSESKQVYHCFGCKKSGNIFTFLRDYNGMNFPDAIEYLADRAGLPLPELSHDQGKQAQTTDQKKLMLKLNKIALDFFRETLKRAPNDHPIKNYISKRKLSVETLQEFQIGFTTSDWDRFTNHLLKNNYDLSFAETAKLIKSKKENNGYFDLFRDRLMFPILSASNEVLAFGGRIYDQGEPKYLNSPETLVFSKSKVLYGLAQTAKYIRSEDCALIVEGYMDLISLYQSGLRHVAATMGTALTHDHGKILKRMTNNVVVLFDGDEAGQAAAERSLVILLSQGLYPRGLVLTEAKDPDEFINQFGADALSKKIQKSSDLFNVVLNSWMQDYRGEASQKVKLVDKIKPIFEAIADARLKSLYADELVSRMSVTKDWLRTAFSQQNRNSSTNYNATRQKEELDQTQEIMPTNSISPELNIDPRENLFGQLQTPIKISDAPQVELMLLHSGIKSRANFEWLINLNEFKTDEEVLINREISFKQLLSQISHLGIIKILQIAEQVYRQDVTKFDKFFTLLIDKIDQPEKLFQNTRLSGGSDSSSVTEFDSEKEQKYLFDLINKIQQNFLKKKSFNMVQQIKTEIKFDKSAMDIDKIKEFIDIQKNRLSLKKKN